MPIPKYKRPRKRWTFMSAAEFLTARNSGEAHVHLNPAGAARLMAWAVRRVAALDGAEWRADQGRP